MRQHPAQAYSFGGTIVTPQEKPTICVCGKETCPVPYGKCHCGCGKDTPLAKMTRTDWNVQRGLPLRYTHGHNKSRGSLWDGKTCVCGDPQCAIVLGTCHCGCGRKTSRAEQSHAATGYLSGMPRKWIAGHSGHVITIEGPTRTVD